MAVKTSEKGRFITTAERCPPSPTAMSSGPNLAQRKPRQNYFFP
jgi:hypothetical protein